MRDFKVAAATALVAVAGAGAAAGDVTYLLQERIIQATTSSNMNTQVVEAQGFGPFIETLALSTGFPAPGGGTAPNEAEVGIDCQLDPNAIRIIGSLSGSGGLSIVGGQPVLQFGEAGTDVSLSFQVQEATPFRMRASPRPGAQPGERFKIELEDETRGIMVFFLDETMPPQGVDISGVMAPGRWSLNYEMEMMFDGPEALQGFFFHMEMDVPPCYANCDGSTVSPVLNISDFVCFMNRYTAGDPYANCDGSTAAPLLNVSDFVCFQAGFAAGCT